MKLKGKIDMMAFLKELKKCTGEVFFETPTETPCFEIRTEPVHLLYDCQ